MIFIRSTIFNIIFYIHMIFWLILCICFLPLPKIFTRWVMKTWASQIPFLLKYICKIKIEARGINNIPNQTIIIASNHQSFLEIILLINYLKSSLMLFKVSLGYIPAFGWALHKLRFIPIIRSGHAKTIRFMIQSIKTRTLHNDQIIIFPEGTRVPSGEIRKLKQGISAIYESLNINCLPVAHNSGFFWPRHKWMKYPGKVIIEFMPIIKNKLSRKEFIENLHSIMMTKKISIEQETICSKNPPPIPITALWLNKIKTKKIVIKNNKVKIY